MKKVRLDQLVFDLGLTESRERAKTTIMSGLVFVDGQRADKPGMQVPPDAKVELHGNALPYVSRGGFKLEKAINEFGISPEGCYCMDMGASTGGFTDCMLQNGAVKVYAVDVGHDQLDARLAADSRVIDMEKTNIRTLTRQQLAQRRLAAAVRTDYKPGFSCFHFPCKLFKYSSARSRRTPGSLIRPARSSYSFFPA